MVVCLSAVCLSVSSSLLTVCLLSAVSQLVSAVCCLPVRQSFCGPFGSKCKFAEAYSRFDRCYPCLRHNDPQPLPGWLDLKVSMMANDNGEGGRWEIERDVVVVEEVDV